MKPQLKIASTTLALTLLFTGASPTLAHATSLSKKIAVFLRAGETGTEEAVAARAARRAFYAERNARYAELMKTHEGIVIQEYLIQSGAATAENVVELTGKLMESTTGGRIAYFKALEDSGFKAKKVKTGAMPNAKEVLYQAVERKLSKHASVPARDLRANLSADELKRTEELSVEIFGKMHPRFDDYGNSHLVARLRSEAPGARAQMYFEAFQLNRYSPEKQARLIDEMEALIATPRAQIVEATRVLDQHLNTLAEMRAKMHPDHAAETLRQSKPVAGGAEAGAESGVRSTSSGAKN